MRRVLPLLVLLAAACSPREGGFLAGILEPSSVRVTVAARRVGLEVSAKPTAGAAVESAAQTGPDGAEHMADWARLRFLAARAATRGADGVYFRLPATPVERDILDYPEEWQALSRVALELRALRPALAAGAPASVPFAVPAEVSFRAWASRGRLYVVLVNGSSAPVRMDASLLDGWRALFEPRADPREAFVPCPGGTCLPPERVLWLEGRLGKTRP